MSPSTRVITLAMILGNQENEVISSAVPNVRLLLMKKRPMIQVTRPMISSRIGTPTTPAMLMPMAMIGFDLSTISCVSCGFAFICTAIDFWICASKIGESTFLLAKKSTIMTTQTTRSGTIGLAFMIVPSLVVCVVM